MLYKRGETYWYSFTWNGRRYQESTGLKNRKAAEDVEAGRRVQLAKGEVGLEDRPRYTIEQLLDRLKQRWEMEKRASPQNLSLLKKTKKAFTGMVDELEQEDLEAYLAKQRKKGCALATVNRVLQCLRRAYRLADVAFPKVKLPSEKGNVRTQRYTLEQWKKILAALPDDGLRDFAEWSYLVGMRKGEASKLTWDVCPKPYNVLHVPGDITKNRVPRDILLEGELAEIIKRRVEARHIKLNGVSTTRESKYIFHRNGDPIYEFRKSWATACKAAGVSGRFHDLRATLRPTHGRQGIRNQS
jgi:integrase